MKCILPYVVVILLASAAGKTFAQTPPDSLRQAIGQARTYREKIQAYINFTEKAGLPLFDEIVFNGTEGMLLAAKNKDEVSQAELKRRVGEAYYFKGKFDTAALYFYDAIHIFERTTAKSSLAQAYNGIAKLYRKTRDLPLALNNYEKAMSIFRSLNDSAGISMIYNESGVVYEYSGDYEEAAKRYTASLEMDERRKDMNGICYALSNLAGVYLLQNKYVQAESYLLKALAIRKEMRDNFALALNYSDLGALYSAAGRLPEAEKYADSSNELAARMGYPELAGNNYDLLADVAAKQGNFELALKRYKQRTALRDSIFNLEKSRQVNELNTKYETEKKERKIGEQEELLKRQTILIFAGAALVSLLALLSYARYRRFKLRRELKAQADILAQQDLATKAVLEAEEAERRRIANDLHDGVGQTMSAAKMNLSAYEDSAEFKTPEERLSFERIIGLIDSACKEVRSVSHNMMPNALLKNSLASAIREFISQLDQNSLKVHVYTEGFDDTLHSNTEIVLYRVVQECVNNVIKHARANSLDISLVKDIDGISVTIEDNGQGFDTAAGNSFEGIGLKNMRARIQYLKGTIEFTSSPGNGTLVALHIPSDELPA